MDTLNNSEDSNQFDERQSTTSSKRRPSNPTLLQPQVLFGLEVLTYLGDLASDCNVATQYFGQNKMLFFWLTLVFAMIPAMVMNIYCFCRYQKESSVNWSTWAVRFLLLVCQMGPLMRFYEEYSLNKRPRKESDEVDGVAEQRNEANDITYDLRKLECFLEDVPQLCLQLIVVLQQIRTSADNTELAAQLISMLVSGLSLLFLVVATHLRSKIETEEKWQEMEEKLPVQSQETYI